MGVPELKQSDKNKNVWYEEGNCYNLMGEQWYNSNVGVVAIWDEYGTEKGCWIAYIGATPGADHKSERWWVCAHGDKLPEALARAFFPGFKTLQYKPY